MKCANPCDTRHLLHKGHFYRQFGKDVSLVTRGGGEAIKHSGTEARDSTGYANEGLNPDPSCDTGYVL